MQPSQFSFFAGDSSGVRFVPIRFTPRPSVFKNEECGGINIIVTDRSGLQSVAAGIEIAVALRRLFPTEWKIDSYSRLLVNVNTLERLKRGDSAEDVTQSWTSSLNDFRGRRARVLLYD